MPAPRAKGKTMKVNWDEVERNKSIKRPVNSTKKRNINQGRKKRLPTKPIKVNNA